MFDSTLALLGYVIGYFLPLVVAFFTDAKTSPARKSLILAGLSALTAVLTQWQAAEQAHMHFAWQAAVVAALVTFAVGQAAHTSLWRNTWFQAVLLALGSKDPILGRHEFQNPTPPPPPAP